MGAVGRDGLGMWVALAVTDGAMQGWLPGVAPWGQPQERQGVAIALGQGLGTWGAVARWLIAQEQGAELPPPPWPASALGQAVAQLPILWRYQDTPHLGLALLDHLGQCPVPALLTLPPWQPAWAPQASGAQQPWAEAIHHSRGEFALALAHSFSTNDPLQPLLTALALGQQYGLGAIPLPWRLALGRPRPGGRLWQQRWQLATEAELQSLAQGLWAGWAGWLFPPPHSSPRPLGSQGGPSDGI